MSDNVQANAGAGGAVFATDDVAGVHYPISKIAFGALDAVTLVTASAGLPVAVVGTVPVSGTVTANAGAGPWPVTDNGGSLTVDGAVTLASDVSTAFSTAGVAVGTSAVQLSTGAAAVRGVLVKAADANTAAVYVGASSGVTAGTTPATDGFQLAAGDSVFLPIDNASKVYVIAAAVSQKVYYLVM